MEKYIIAPPAGSQINALGAKDRPWEEVHAKRYPGINEYLAESTGYGIVSGCTPSSTGLTVTVAAGIAHLADGTHKELAESTVTLDAADSTNPRIDLVYITATGAVAKITGMAAASPSAPSVPVNGIPVANVSVMANGTTGILTDIRGMLARWYNTGVVNVKDFGAVGDGATDDSDAIQNAINHALNKKGCLLIPPGKYYVSKGITAAYKGESYLHIAAYGATIITDKDITVFTITSAVSLDKVQYYSDRIEKVWVEGLRLQGIGTGTGLELSVFGTEVLFDRVSCLSFSYGMKIYEGSEFVARQCQVAGCNCGLFVGSNSNPPIIDTQAMYFDRCNIHNNVENNIVVKNQLELYINGGSWMSVSKSDNGGIYFTGKSNGHIEINNVDFEQSGFPSIYIDTHPDLIVAQNQFAPTNISVPIIYVNNAYRSSSLNVINNYIDSVYSPLIYMRNNISKGYIPKLSGNEPKDKIIINEKDNDDLYIRPYYIDGKIYKPWAVEMAYGKDTWGSFSCTFDTNEFVSGKGSLHIAPNTYLSILTLKEGHTYTIDYIAATATGKNVSTSLIIVKYNKLTGKYGDQMGLPDCIGANAVPAQSYKNGFKRYILTLTVEDGYNMLLRTGGELLHTDVYLDRLAIYCKEQYDAAGTDVPTLPAVPTTGTYEIGDYFKSAKPEAGGYIGYVCTTGGTPGTWKGFGSISS